MNHTWIMTHSGRPFWPLSPRLEDIDIEDIAHALACVNRFNGHTREPYSVAQHAVYVADHVLEATEQDSVAGLYGLLHDASEAYIADVSRPLKHAPAFADYRAAEETLQAAIYRAFGLAIAQEPALVRAVDRRMLRTEQRDLMPSPWSGEDRSDVEPYPGRIVPWHWLAARETFLVTFRRLKAAAPRPAQVERVVWR